MKKKICILLYSIVAFLALRRVVRNMCEFRRNYIEKRTGGQHVIKVHVRLMVIIESTAYILGERNMLIQAFPKVSGFHLVVTDAVRKNTAKFVIGKMCKIYNQKFGEDWDLRCYISAYTRKEDDDIAMIVKRLKEIHHTREAFLMKYAKYRDKVEEIIDWFDHESLSEPVKMEYV